MRLSLMLAAVLAVGCSAARDQSTNSAGQAGVGGHGATATTGGTGGVELSGSGGGPPGEDCPPEAEQVYVVDSVNTLYSFDPPTLTFSTIGVLSCTMPPISAVPFSMAVDRNAQAWMVALDGRLFQIDTENAACTQTGYSANQHGFAVFGMGFSTDGPGSRTDRLYVHDNTPFYDFSDPTWSGLATIDLSALSLEPIGLYTQLASSRAELTGTGDGRLFGFFPDEVPPVVAEIDKTNVAILSATPQASVDSMNGGFAFAHWGGDFWLFFSTPTNPSGSVVARFQPALTMTSVVKSDVPFVIVGAGVSTCAPLQPPE